MTAATSRATVERGAAPAATGLLSRSAFALFSPLCVASGRVPRALAWLEERGFEVACTQTLQLGRAHVDGLWERLIPTVAPRRVQVVADAMMAGPSLLVAFRHPGAATAATARLRALKGSADPAARPEHSLRTHLGAPNLLTSLVHTPDTPEDLVRELEVLVPGVDEREEVWRALGDGASGGRSMRPVVPGEVPPPPVAAFVVGVRLRARLLDRLLDRSAQGALPALGGLVEDMAREVDREREAAERSDPFAPLAALARHRETLSPQRHRLEHALGPEGPASAVDEQCRLLSRAYAELEAMEEGEPFDLPLLTACLDRTGIPLTTWERVVLGSESLTPSPARA
ncbi:nucleoside-diphosphate kinase [Cellulomonas fimi]|uniref:nucleoside-diphosphate kinase n=1 Tax=Cellulomonas fimi TaxID=1708 RepID=UPI0023582FC6|nr:nucleoside-diphosphate kinase [Cellulomonas fimi]